MFFLSWFQDICFRVYLKRKENDYDCPLTFTTKTEFTSFAFKEDFGWVPCSPSSTCSPPSCKQTKYHLFSLFVLRADSRSCVRRYLFELQIFRGNQITLRTWSTWCQSFGVVWYWWLKKDMDCTLDLFCAKCKETCSFDLLDL